MQPFIYKKVLTNLRQKINSSRDILTSILAKRQEKIVFMLLLFFMRKFYKVKISCKLLTFRTPSLNEN